MSTPKINQHNAESMPSCLRSLTAQPITPENFRPYGQVISASADGKPFDAEDAQLRLDRGIPRFYIMRLGDRGRKFSQITRHQHCTQCLGSLAGQEWLIAVAPPSLAETPNVEAIAAFRIPGSCFIKLEVGTWHAGPYFEQTAIDFYNLELSDTNVTDHQTCDLQATYGIEFELG
jgi:ureidoglycolate hydrolase